MGREATFAVGLYRLALLAFPGRLRAAYGDEMVAAFGAALEQRRALGRRAAQRFTTRAWLDAVRAGLGARLGSSPVGGPPRGPVRRFGHALRDRLWVELGADLRQAFRALAATPSFTLAALAVLALGVGVNGALFTAVRAAILAEAPFPESERLVFLELMTQSTETDAPPESFAWSYPKYELLAARDDLLAAPIAAYARRTLTLTGDGEPTRIVSEIVTGDYFDLLGAAMLQGGSFGGADPAHQIVVSHALWRDRYGGEPLTGREIRVNGEVMQVVGVAPPGFRGLTGISDAWIPMDAVPVVVSTRLLDNADGHWLRAIGRLRPAATLAALQAQMEGVGSAVHEAFEWTDPTERQVGAALSLEEARLNPRARRAVVVVSGAAAAVLLIACVNLMILLLARGRDRQREIAVRQALGGSRWRVSRGLIVETLLLSLVAGLLGAALAAFATGGIAAAWPDNFVNGSWNMRFVDASSFRFDAGTFAFTVGLALSAGLLFAVGPALRLTRGDLTATMRRGAGASDSRQATRSILVAAEVAIALVLTVGAGLMIASLGRLLDVDDGFDDANLLTVGYTIPSASPASTDPAAFHGAVVERVRALPGVVDATFDCAAPRAGHCWITGIDRAGDQVWEPGRNPRIGVHVVDERYFDVLGIRALRGRVFSADEGAETAPVVVINEAAVDVLFPNSDPIGQPFAAGVNLTSSGDTATIIGVVSDVLYNTPAEGVMPELYLLNRQEPDRSVSLIVRTAGDPFAPLSAIRSEIGTLEPDMPLYGVATVAALGARQVGDTTAVMALLTIFAGLAIVLSATGVWGVVASAVTGRAREIGIRVALGALPGQVVSLALRQGAVSAVVGGAVGVAAAVGLSRLLTALLYEVSPTELGPLLGSAAALLVITLLAAWLPARRAARLDPVRSLRAE